MDRKLCDNGLAFYSTINYHECRKVVEELYPPDAAIIQTTPMDDHGFFNFGPNASHHHSLCMGSKHVIVETNNTVPRCLGGFGEAVHISQVEYIVEGSNTPIFELPKAIDSTPEDEKIADLLLEEIEDRACLQLGIGALPSLVGNKIAVSDLKDLGIHTEMFVDAYMDMIMAGKVTGRYKTTDRGKCVYTFSMGTRELYDFMDDNPLLASCCGDYTNNPRIIASNDKAVSINNAVEVDLFSQICGESYGPRQISGTGGQLDFAQGVFESNGGKAFICIHSTYLDKGQLKSRIVPCLQSGGIVTTPRSVVSYVVTEFGKALLKGRSTWERAEALIAIAHPQFQDELINEAKRMKIWTRSNQIR
jgi:acyl-CoA hydrolase